jgi:hypothetical protein
MEAKRPASPRALLGLSGSGRGCIQDHRSISGEPW